MIREDDIINDKNFVFLKSVVTSPDIQVGDYTIYYDYKNNPEDFERNNILYYTPGITPLKIIIGKFCSIAMGTSFLSPVANHNMDSLSTYPFGLFPKYWDLPAEYSTPEKICYLKGKGPTVIGNDVWIGCDALILPGVHIGDGAIIGAHSVVSKDVEPYTVVGGNPIRFIRKRYNEASIDKLLKIKWWNLRESELKEALPYILEEDIDGLVKKIIELRVIREIENIRTV